MSTTEIWEIAGAILLALGGGGAIILGLSSWLGREWARRLMRRDLERHETGLEHLKSQLQRLTVEHQVRFARVDAKQAEVIVTIHGLVFSLRTGLARLEIEFEGREIREDVDRKYHRQRRPDYVLEPGIDTLTAQEQTTIDAIVAQSRALSEYFGRNRLYVPAVCCELLDRFTSLSWFVADSYKRVAIKDKDGNLFVNPDVMRVRNAAVGTIPDLLAQLEVEFRRHVSVAAPAS